ncbi:hypothetical protein QP519_10700 [Weeksella virosa]|uniref:hypothetical protein n=1 Tax=Weeksella virosa TaxID=1014 RepID=UPI00255230CF|nr:hypothetical protein [Weeksella virosa]MDK7376003.1 hypothetical protein [Weeksella virosa]
MPNNLIEIVNLPDDIERKVIRFAFLENHQDFDYLAVIDNGIPNLNDLGGYNGFAVRPIEGDTSVNITNARTDAGTYAECSVSFSVDKQEDSDVMAIGQFINKKGILIIETSTYNYMIGSYEEPLMYASKENEKTIKVTCNGSQRRRVLRKKISPF